MKHATVIGAFLFTLIIAGIVAFQIEQRQMQDDLNHLRHEADMSAASVQRNVDRALSAALPLAALVRHHRGMPPDFEALATQMLPMYVGAGALGLAPDGIIRINVPMAENRKSIGHDLLNDPGRNKEARLARDTGVLTLAGPFKLVQGGFGAAGRMPIYLGGDGTVAGSRFWGFVTVLIRFPEVLAGTNLEHHSRGGIAYALWRIHPDTGERHVIAAGGKLPPQTADAIVRVPNGEWILSLGNPSGLVNPPRIAAKVGGALLIALLAGLLALRLSEQRQQTRELEWAVSDALAQASLQEHFLRQAFDAVPIGVSISDPTGGIVYANPHARELLGLREGDKTDAPLVDRGWPTIRPDGTPMPPDECASARALRERQVVAGVTMGIAREDGLRWVSVNAAPSPDPRYGVVTGYVDITPLKTLEFSLVKTKMLAETAAEQLREAESIASMGHWVVELATGRLEWSDETCRMFGVSKGAPVDLTMFGTIIHPDDRGPLFAAWGSALQRGGMYEQEHRIVVNGEVRWVLERADISRAKDGRVVGTVLDTTARKQAETYLLEAKQAAEAANVAKSRFLATMSHELRTPMNGVLGMAQLLLEGTASEAQAREYARTILHSGQSLLSLLNDILDLSKVEAGKLALEAGVVSPGELLRETSALFAASAHAKGLGLTVAWAGSPDGRYCGDPHRLRQMLANLTNNAIKFTSRGDVHIEGREVEADGTSVILEFSVTDTGIGIPADKQALLFKPFSQLDASSTRQFGGTGLGLSIVRSLARLMGGEVGVESEPGKGSRFWFRVRLDALEKDADTRSEPRAMVAAETGFSLPRLSGRVLVVEDIPVNRIVIGAMLKSMGIEAVLAEDGAQGVDRVMAEAGSLDAVLMDIQMPVLDGLEATARIRAWEREQHRQALPIIAVTADAFSEDEARCREAGMNDYVSKPINATVLAAALARWLPAAPQATDAMEATPPAAPRPVDWPSFRAQAEALLPLLGAAKYDAVRRFPDLEALAAGTPLEAEMAAIRQDVVALRFTRVRDALVSLLARHSTGKSAA